MSSTKIALTAAGAAGVAAAVPLQHFLLRRNPTTNRSAIMGGTSLLFLAGWASLGAGLVQPPADFAATAEWKSQQLILTVVGIVAILAGVGLVRFRKGPVALGGAVFVAGWAVLTAAVVYSNPTFTTAAPSDRAVRVTYAVLATLITITGAALLSMTDATSIESRGRSTVAFTHRTLEAAAASVFAAGWAGVAVTSL